MKPPLSRMNRKSFNVQDGTGSLAVYLLLLVSRNPEAVREQNSADQLLGW